MSTADEMNDVISRAIAEIEKLRREKAQLVSVLDSIVAMVEGECPGLAEDNHDFVKAHELLDRANDNA